MAKYLPLGDQAANRILGELSETATNALLAFDEAGILPISKAPRVNRATLRSLIRRDLVREISIGWELLPWGDDIVGRLLRQAKRDLALADAVREIGKLARQEVAIWGELVDPSLAELIQLTRQYMVPADAGTHTDLDATSLLLVLEASDDEIAAALATVHAQDRAPLEPIPSTHPWNASFVEAPEPPVFDRGPALTHDGGMWADPPKQVAPELEPYRCAECRVPGDRPHKMGCSHRASSQQWVSGTLSANSAGTFVVGVRPPVDVRAEALREEHRLMNQIAAIQNAIDVGALENRGEVAAKLADLQARLNTERAVL